MYASDTADGEAHRRWAATLRAAGAEVQLGGHDLDRIGRAAAVVVAPGVPPDVPALQAARGAGLAIVAETDLGFLALRGTRCIGITGTNGKTTTTSLTAHLLQAAAIRAETGANLSVDLQENYRLATVVAPHVDKIRYNPGHLHHHERSRSVRDKVAFLAEVAARHDVALRIGVNCGSVDPEKAGAFGDDA